MKYLQTYNQLFEKSILTRVGIPNKIMKVLQNAYRIGSESEAREIPAVKKYIRDELEDKGSLVIILKQDETYLTIYHHSWKNKNKMYKLIKFSESGYKVYVKSLTITNLMKQLELTGDKIFVVKRGNYKSFRVIKDEDKKEESEINNTLEEFREYFNKNATKILKKLYAKRWKELVGAVRQYYDKITTDPETFISRLPDEKYYGGDEFKKKTADFASMGWVLQDFAEKLNKDGEFDMSYDYVTIISEFIKNRNDIDVSDINDPITIDENKKIVAKAIKEFGVMKMTTLWARYVMSKTLDWIRDKVNKYSGLEDEVSKYNL